VKKEVARWAKPLERKKSATVSFLYHQGRGGKKREQILGKEEQQKGSCALPFFVRRRGHSGKRTPSALAYGFTK